MRCQALVHALGHTPCPSSSHFCHPQIYQFAFVEMFKTVRVGDTSLQYAIVSQSEESSGAAFVTTPPHRAKTKRKTRYRKTVILILITLIMGCCVVIAAVLVPILVASKLVGNLPESAKFQTFAIAASSIQGYNNKYDHNGHRYVELLPIKERPVDAVIEFQDDIPVIGDSRARFFVTSTPVRPSESVAAVGAVQQSWQLSSTTAGNAGNSTTLTNVNQVTLRSNNQTRNVIADQQGLKMSSSSSLWYSTSHLLENMTTLLVQRRLTLILVAFLLVLMCVTIVGVVRYHKRKSISKQIETHEHQAQRKQLLAAVPIEDD